MIQLSSPAPEHIPVRTGTSPEKAAAPSNGDGRFEKALEQSRRLSRSEEHRAPDGTETRRVSVRTEEGSAKSDKTSQPEKKAGDSESVTAGKKKSREQEAGRPSVEAAQAEKGMPSGKTLLSLVKKRNIKNSADHSSDGAKTVVHKGEDASVSVSVSSLFDKASSADGAVMAAAAVSGGQVPAAETGEPVIADDASGDTADAALSLLENAVSGRTEGNDAEKGTLLRSLKITKKSEPTGQKKGDVSKITVDDQRTPLLKEEGLVLKKVEAGSEGSSLTLELAGTDEELPGMMLRADGDQGGARFSLQTAEESKGAALLDRQLKNEGTAELTKSIRFVLKDNNEGEIKLILKPEALGKVRINLNLNENNIVGKIIVENNSVRQVFMNNLPDLTRALENSGFNSAALDVSVGGGQSEGRGGFRDERPVYFTDNALDELEDMIPVVYDEGHSLSQVNLVV